MAGRRIAPLIVTVLLGAALLMARLFQLQVREHELWTAEAANLVRSGSIRPYTRGAILDARGRMLRSDRSTYALEFVYREFRRGHPLGQVAHARAALSGTSVPLAVAFEHLEAWCEELLQLTPQQLESFAAGAALEHGALRIPASVTPQLDERRARRADARFYLTALLQLPRVERRKFTQLAQARPQSSWLELAASTLEIGAHQVLAAVSERVRTSRDDLRALARALALEQSSPEAPVEAQVEPEAALALLLQTLDSHRERVDDESASALFREAAGFAVHRVEAHTLHACVELDWIAVRLAWDEQRTLDWLERTREAYRRTLAETLPERIAAQLELEARGPGAPERVIASWAAPFAKVDSRAEDAPWRSWTALVALDELAGLLELREVELEERDSVRAPVLAFERVRNETASDEPLSWLAVARAELGASAAPGELETAARAWSEAFDGRFDREFVRARTASVLVRWDRELQLAIQAQLRGPLERAGPAARWSVRPQRLERAGERARFVLKDYGNRARPLLQRPSYALTHFITRHRDRFAGFVVQDTHERVAHIGRDGRPVAEALIGAVGAPTFQEELLARDLRRDFHALARKGVRARTDSEELTWLAQSLTRPDELRGRGGIEAYFERELAGRNGYREVRGMQDLIDGAFELDVAPVDGSDLTLTLDLDVQEAASAVLAAPEGPPDPASSDYAWLSRPTGALVFLRVDGSVLAAASHPARPRDDRGSPGIADAAFERTLRKPGFQPPGSSFKPFVALWSLERIAASDPQRLLECAMLPDGLGAGYVDVRCNTRYGHGAVDLRDALKRSCNSYFAMLGERFTLEDWRGLAAEFGFGQPTGVRCFGRRPGLMEDTFSQLFERELLGRNARLAGNGLAVVEATPMQLARATAAIATGALPQLRLVKRVGATEIASEARPLAISRASLDFVREAMEACANEPGGSAREALGAAQLDWRFAAKTGSGDISVERVETADGHSRVRKHTWLIGYFPAEAPRYVLVVFCHDTLQTASQSSIWIARQFLQRSEVREFVAQDEEAR